MTDLPWAVPMVTLVVCGAHLQGQPLNPALMALGAVFAGAGQTARSYRMYALPALPALEPAGPVGGSAAWAATPARPGLVRQVEGVDGAAIEVELYELPLSALGEFLVTIRPPLAIGHLLMDDGSEQLGFVCESYAAQDGADITDFGNWRDYLEMAPATPALP